MPAAVSSPVAAVRIAMELIGWSVSVDRIGREKKLSENDTLRIGSLPKIRKQRAIETPLTSIKMAFLWSHNAIRKALG